MNNNIFNLINKLPTDIINIIEEYIPKKEFTFTIKKIINYIIRL